MNGSKVALIFGHTSGLGHQLCERLLGAGYKVVGIARRTSDIASSDLTNIAADLSKETDVIRVAREIETGHAIFDALIFCAGSLTAHDLDGLDYSDMEYQFRVNLFAPMTIESRLLHMVQANGADVLNVTSSAIVDYYPKFAEYSAAKMALKKFTGDLQTHLKDTPCRVMEFCPSGFTSSIYQTMTGDKIERDESLQMRAEDLADLMVYLLQLPKNIEIASIFVNRKISRQNLPRP